MKILKYIKNKTTIALGISLIIIGGAFFVHPDVAVGGSPAKINLMFLKIYDLGATHTGGSDKDNGDLKCTSGATETDLDGDCPTGTPCTCTAAVIENNYYRIEFQIENTGGTVDDFSGFYQDLGNLFGTVDTANDIWVTDGGSHETCTSSTFSGGKLDWSASDGGCILSLSASEQGKFQFIIQIGSGATLTSGADLFAKEDSSADSLDAFVEISVAGAAAATLELGTHRWFQNLDAVEPGGAASINQPIIAPPQGTPFRLRMNLHVNDADLGISGTTTKLEFAERSGTCDKSFTGESYAEVTTSSIIRYYDNTGVSDNAAIGTHGFDPLHSSTTASGFDTMNRQNYNDGTTDTTFTNAQSAINQDEDGLWDFSLVDNSAPSGTSYCFRPVQSGGGVIGSYGLSTLPEIQTQREIRVRLRGTVRLRRVRLF